MTGEFTIKYLGKTYHIAGIDEITPVSSDGMTYSLSACPSLSRNRHKMGTSRTAAPLTDLATALKDAELSARVRNGKVCGHCAKAAARLLDES